MVEFENRDEPGMDPQPASDHQPVEEVDMAFSKRSTPPAFQLYAAEFLAGDKVSRMSYLELGIFIALLCHAWTANGLPASVIEIAKKLKINPPRFAKIWAGVLSECWVERNGRLVNPRQEIERKKQREYREKQRNAAASRWDKTGISQAHALQSSSSSSTSTPKEQENKKISSEPSNGSEPPVLTFPTVGPSSTWGLSSVQLAEWQALFPNIHVWTEMQKVSAWLPANMSKRKTAKGMPRFLVAWLTRAVDGANGNGHRPAPAQRQAAQEPVHEPWTCPHVEDHASQWRCEQATALNRPRKADAS